MRRASDRPSVRPTERLLVVCDDRPTPPYIPRPWWHEPSRLPFFPSVRAGHYGRPYYIHCRPGPAARSSTTRGERYSSDRRRRRRRRRRHLFYGSTATSNQRLIIQRVEICASERRPFTTERHAMRATPVFGADVDDDDGVRLVARRAEIDASVDQLTRAPVYTMSTRSACRTTSADH